MQEGLGLFVEGGGDGGVTVPEAGDGEPREQVEVALAGFVPKPGAFAPHEGDGRLRIRGHER